MLSNQSTMTFKLSHTSKVVIGGCDQLNRCLDQTALALSYESCLNRAWMQSNMSSITFIFSHLPRTVIALSEYSV